MGFTSKIVTSALVWVSGHFTPFDVFFLPKLGF